METDKLLQKAAFKDYVQEVRLGLEQFLPEAPHKVAELRAEIENRQLQCSGWMESLSKPSLAPELRTVIESEYAQAQANIKTFSARLAQATVLSQQVREAVDPGRIASGLVALAGALKGKNAAITNILLAQHVEGIRCDQDGKIDVRLCKLGVLAEALDLIPTTRVDVSAGHAPNSGVYSAEPRRRGRLELGPAYMDDEAAARANEFGVDPNRFGGLEPEWFTSDVAYLPPRISWAETNSRNVAEYRMQTHASMAATALHFGKSIPTIRNSLRIAKAVYGLDAFGKAVSQPARRCWARDNADLIGNFFSSPGTKLKDAVAHFGKSEPTIQKALALFRARDTASSESRV